MKNNTICILVLALLLITLTACGNDKMENLGVVKDVTISEAVTSISVNWYDGEVKIVGSNNTEIRIEQTARQELPEANQFTYSFSAGNLHINDNNSNAVKTGSGSNNLVIYLPETKLDALTLQSPSAKYWVEDICTTSLVLDGSGTFVVAGEFITINYTGVSGSCSVTCTTMPDTINMESNTGNIFLILPENDGFTLYESTNSGSVTCGFPLTSNGSGAVYGDGSCSITVKLNTGKAEISSR